MSRAVKLTSLTIFIHPFPCLISFGLNSMLCIRFFIAISTSRSLRHGLCVTISTSRLYVAVYATVSASRSPRHSLRHGLYVTVITSRSLRHGPYVTVPTSRSLRHGLFASLRSISTSWSTSFIGWIRSSTHLHLFRLIVS